MTLDKKNINIKTKQSVVWYTALPFTLHFFRFANSILLARILMPSDFGIMGIVAVILYYCNSVTDFGLAKAIIQRKDVEAGHFNAYFCFNVIVSTVLFIVFQLLSTHISNFFNEPNVEAAIEVYAIMFLVTAFIAVPQASLKRDLDFKALAIIEAIKVFFSMGISLSLALNGYGFWSMIYAMLASQVIALILTLAVSKARASLFFKFQHFKDLASFGIWDFFWGQTKLIGDNIDKLIIAKFLGTTQLGFYDKAIGLAKMPNEQLSDRLSAVSFSTFSRLQDEKTEVQKYFSKLMITNMTFILPIFIGLSAVSHNLTFVLLGDKWLEMAPSLAILSISYLLASISSPVVAMNMAGGLIKSQALIRLLSVMILIISLILTAPYGIEAASFTILSFNVLLFVLSSLLLKKHFFIKLSTLTSYFLPPFVSSMLMLLMVMTTQSFVWAQSPLLNLLASVFMGMLVYLFCFLFIPFKQWEFLQSKLKKKIEKLIKNSNNKC
jgi:PST family polysaccharide transporter